MTPEDIQFGHGPEEIAQAVRVLREGGLVAFPTETVYGLGADALDARAVARVFEAKGRPANNPLIVHVSDEAMAASVAASWPAEASRLAREFWPGPLSIVVPRAARVPAIVTAGGPNVAVRCPDHGLTLALIEALGKPLVGPSANRSGSVSPTTAGHVRASLPGVFVLDGGPCRAGIESTVVSLVGEARVLRPGVIGADQIAQVLGRRVMGPELRTALDSGATKSGVTSEGTVTGPMESPGMMDRHYAPSARVIMVDAAAVSRSAASAGGSAVVVAREWSGTGVRAVLRMPVEAHAYAARLYAALREADDLASGGVIIIERPPTTGDVWSAVHDRLTRACG